MQKSNFKINEGFGLVELVIATAIISIAFFAFLQTGIVAVRLLRNEKENLEATVLLQETMEVTRAVRDESWSANIGWRTDVSNPSPRYYPIIQNGKWLLATTSPGLVNGRYDRYVTFERVNRDGSDRIAVSGSDDPGTKKIKATVTWGAKTKEITAYATNFLSTLGTATESVEVSFESSTTDADLGNFPSNNAGNGDPVQGFTTLTNAISVTKAELYLRRTTTSPSNIYAEIRATSPTGTMLGTSNVINSSTLLNSGLSWVEFRFADPISLQAATMYYIRLRSIPLSTDAFSGSVGTVNWGYLQTGPSPYSGGQARRYVGRLSNPTDNGQILDQYDFGFKVYKSN